MKVGIPHRKEHRVFRCGLHFGDDAPQILNVFFRRLLSCKPRVLYLEKRSDLVQVLKAYILTPSAKKEIQRLDDVLAAPRPNRCAHAMTGLEESVGCENSHRFTHNSAAYPETVGEFSF